jgi:uncharacterized membrane protein YhiD involved in acid resistance
MDRERALTVAIVAFVAGSTAMFVVLTVVGGLTDNQDTLRFTAGIVSGVGIGLATGWAVHARADPGQLRGR